MGRFICVLELKKKILVYSLVCESMLLLNSSL